MVCGQYGVRWSGIPVDECSIPGCCSKSCICRPRKHRAIRGANGILPMRVGGATSQLDLPSLTPFSVAGCGRLKLGVPHWATSVDYCK